MWNNICYTPSLHHTYTHTPLQTPTTLRLCSKTGGCPHPLLPLTIDFAHGYGSGIQTPQCGRSSRQDAEVRGPEPTFFILWRSVLCWTWQTKHHFNLCLLSALFQLQKFYLSFVPRHFFFEFEAFQNTFQVGGLEDGVTGGDRMKVSRGWLWILSSPGKDKGARNFLWGFKNSSNWNIQRKGGTFFLHSNSPPPVQTLQSITHGRDLFRAPEALDSLCIGAREPNGTCQRAARTFLPTVTNRSPHRIQYVEPPPCPALSRNPRNLYGWGGRPRHQAFPYSSVHAPGFLFVVVWACCPCPSPSVLHVLWDPCNTARESMWSCPPERGLRLPSKSWTGYAPLYQCFCEVIVFRGRWSFGLWGLALLIIILSVADIHLMPAV